MFEQSLIELNIKKGSSRWAIVISSALQALLLGVLILIPLLNYYELPAAELMTFLVAPPPPPPPPPPPELAPQKVAPEKFDPMAAPTEIPDEVAIIEEAIPAPSQTIAGVVGGVIGGTPGGQVGGVIADMTKQMPILQAAEYYNVSERTLRRRIQSGQVTGRKVKGRWFVDVEQGKVDNSAASRRQNAGDVNEITLFDSGVAQRQLETLQFVAVLPDPFGAEYPLRYESISVH